MSFPVKPPSFQTHFVTTMSPLHHGSQDFLHQDVHWHLASPSGTLIGRPIGQDNHRPFSGQSTLLDFTLQKKDGLW